MSRRGSANSWWVVVASASTAMVAFAVGVSHAKTRKGYTATPIKHLIVIVGENHTFDNVFGGYRPRKGQSVFNLLSEGIINADGTPGANFSKAAQNMATDTKTYSPTPTVARPYTTLPQPNTTYAFGQPQGVADPRFPANLPNGPFQISKYTSYQLGFTGDPAHRFFQMWQDYDGGRLDLFTWVGITIGAGSNGAAQVSRFTDQTTEQGGVAMGFTNMSAGDAPVLKFIADNYAIGDNYHQGIMGGTGANFIYLGTADVGFFTDGSNDNLPAAVPPGNQIENPDPTSGTNNWYKQDGYRGGSYINCADSTQHGVAPILNYLNSLSYKPKSNCEAGHYYLLNNYSPAYDAEGNLLPLPPANATSSTIFRLPPQTRTTIGDTLSAASISWKYYIGGLDGGKPNDSWCSICNPMQFTKSIMTTGLRNNTVDIPQFYSDLANGDLPAVSFVRPYEGYSGHPADSTLSLYEYFITNVVNAVISKSKVFDETAILITVDEGGGYYDSGYIQPLDFFGDGTRIPLLVVSPYVKKGFIDHTYYDHGSILKFIEANWGLTTLSGRSRDNLPNPTAADNNPYVPTNAPAIGDLTKMFDFVHKRDKKDTPLIIPGGI
jgi:acid phosphatase